MEGPPAHYVRCLCSTCKGAWVSRRTRSNHKVRPRYAALGAEQTEAQPQWERRSPASAAGLRTSDSAGGICSSDHGLREGTSEAEASNGRAVQNEQQVPSSVALASSLRSGSEGAAEVVPDSGTDLQQTLQVGPQQPVTGPHDPNVSDSESHASSAASSDEDGASVNTSKGGSSLPELDPAQEGTVRLGDIQGQQGYSHE